MHKVILAANKKRNTVTFKSKLTCMNVKTLLGNTLPKEELMEELKQNYKDQKLFWAYNTRAKRLSLRVDYKQGLIRLTIPQKANYNSVKKFLDTNKNWINEKQLSLNSKVLIKNGSTVAYMGNDYKIIIRKHTKRTTDIIVYRNEIHINTSRDDPSNNFKRWMIEQARTFINDSAHAKADKIGKKITKIDLRDTSSRWGSCSSDKRLMFSWRLIMAPPYVLDYVIGHEVAHLKHMDHSKKFWSVCYTLCDEPDSARHWLKQNGNTLLRFF